MKILALSDKVVPLVYSAQIRDRYGDVDLVIGCGDLPYYYLEYVVTMLTVPLIYIYGNHDKIQYTATGRILGAPEGCISVDGQVRKVGGLLVAGLGGSIRYRPNASHQYTEGEMRARILRLVPKLLWNRVRYGRFLDILVTHSPPYSIHDGEDAAHQGFTSFLTFMRYFSPVYLLHGHKHLYNRNIVEETVYKRTMVVNVYPRRLFEWESVDQ